MKKLSFFHTPGFLLCGLIQDNAADSFIFYSDILIKNKKERCYGKEK